MARFPKIPTERTCLTEQRMRNSVRQSYKKRLIDEREAAKRILDQSGEASQTNG
jgi:hypothetical protein